MRFKKWIALAGVLAGLVLLVGLSVQASPPGQGPGPQGDVRAQGGLGTAASTVLSTSFTYQGQLKSGGEPVDESCEMAFRLYDGESGNNQVGSAITHTVPISDGLFTVLLDFGSSVFTGDARWLGIQVKCPGDAAYADLGRQALTATPYALYAASAWQVGGNAGTTPGVDYLGTSDGVTLTLAVSGTAALRLVPHATSPNVIGGHSANSVAAGVAGATIGGGGDGADPNRVTYNYATIGGGRGNQANGNNATVGGGQDNTASSPGSTVGGGYLNAAQSGNRATIGGGQHNTTWGDNATVGGGGHNTVWGNNATVGGGWYNAADGNRATVGGGWYNAANGLAATVGGGQNNTASGDYSFAAGQRAKAVHQGAFVWADSTDVDYTSTITDQFAIRASNGVSLSVNAGSSKAIAVGERYRDNAIIAWAKVISDGTTAAASFGVESVSKIGTGQYAITITAQTADATGAVLIPMAVAEVDAAPIGAAAMRIVSITQVGARTFEVYINDGTFVLQDNDFVFVVTGR